MVESKRKREEEEEAEAEEKGGRKKMKMEAANIPADVLADILSRLPAKCVWGLRSVSKDWKSLIESPYFADLQLRRGSKEEDEVFMVCSVNVHRRRGTTRFYSIDYEDGKAVRAVEEDFYHPFNTRTSSINGLVCYYGTDWEIKVCNPVTRETITLPKPSFLSQQYRSHLDLGIGFDSPSNTYKVLAVNRLYNPQAEIFTLGKATNPNGWRKLQLSSTQMKYCYEQGLYANGCALWCNYEIDQDRHRLLPVLMTFNYAQEKFEIFPFPSNFNKHHACTEWINQVGGQGCLIQAKLKMKRVKLWTFAPASSRKVLWLYHHTVLPHFPHLIGEPVIFPIPSGVMLFTGTHKQDKKKRNKRDNMRNQPRRYICFYNEGGQVVKSIRVHGIPRRFYPLQLHRESLVSLTTISS